MVLILDEKYKLIKSLTELSQSIEVISQNVVNLVCGVISGL